MADEVTKGDAVMAVAKEGGIEAAGFLVDLMARNERDIEWALEQSAEGYKRDAERWKQRALDAEQELFEVRSRVLTLIGLGGSYE